jgi:hypothetical protein
MKRVLGLFTVLLIAGMTSFVFAEPYHGSRYNPYNPYLNEGGRDQVPDKERRGYESDKWVDTYVTEPRRWYDSQENYQKSYEKNVNDPKTLTNPYRDVRPYSSSELTRPYEGVIPQSPDSSPTNQQLTPPTKNKTP